MVEGCSGENYCNALNECDDCVLLEGCAWCPEREACLPSDRPDGCELIRDIDGRCDPSVCYDVSNCSECVAIRGCGFCESVKSCYPADVTFCELVEIDTNCPLEDCEDAENCEDCHSIQCNWCDSDGGFCHSDNDVSCLFAYDYPPDGPALACPEPNSCFSNDTCRSCLANYDCGWCVSPSLIGTAEGLCLLQATSLNDWGMRCGGYFMTLGCE